MSKSKSLFFTAVTLFSFITFQSNLSASEDDVDTLTQDTMKIPKDEIVKSLDNLKKEGKISDADYQKAKTELLAMSDEQLNGIKKKAEGMIRNDPDKAVDLVKQKKIDLKEVEKQAVEVKK